MGKEPYTGNFCHNDMDMLVVGMHGASNDGFITGSKIGGCTDQEYLTHFALWAIMGSPLIMWPVIWWKASKRQRKPC